MTGGNWGQLSLINFDGAVFQVTKVNVISMDFVLAFVFDPHHVVVSRGSLRNLTMWQHRGKLRGGLISGSDGGCGLESGRSQGTQTLGGGDLIYWF